MFSGEIAVHPQLLGMDHVVPVKVPGAGTLVICQDSLRLGDINSDLVRWRIQLVELLTEDVPPLSNSTRHCHGKLSIPIDPSDGDKFHLTSLLVN